MNYINLPENLHRALIENGQKLEMENEKLRKENEELKIAVQKMYKRLQEMQNEILIENKMGQYVNSIRSGAFKPRLNTYIDEETILKTILKLKTTDINIIAKELDVSYSTIRRRLIQYNQYPINLKGILDTYILFYSADDVENREVTGK